MKEKEKIKTDDTLWPGEGLQPPGEIIDGNETTIIPIVDSIQTPTPKEK